MRSGCVVRIAYCVYRGTLTQNDFRHPAYRQFTRNLVRVMACFPEGCAFEMDGGIVGFIEKTVAPELVIPVLVPGINAAYRNGGVDVRVREIGLL